MNLSRDDSDYGTSSSMERILRRSGAVDNDTNGSEDSTSGQRIIPKRNSDCFGCGGNERVVEAESDPYRNAFSSVRNQKSENGSVGGRTNNDREDSYATVFQQFRNDAFFHKGSFEPSNSLSQGVRSFYNDSYHYKPHPDSRLQGRISNSATTSSLSFSSSPPSILSREARNNNNDRSIYNTYQIRAPNGPLGNREYLDPFNVEGGNDTEDYWDKKSQDTYNTKTTRSCVRIVDDEDSRVERKMPAETRRFEQPNKPVASLSDHIYPKEEPAKKTIEVAPGCVFRLRGADETWNAVLNDFYMPYQCVCCEVTVFCIQDADYSVCPTCRVVNPLPGAETNEGRGGVGLGFLVEDLVTWQKRIAKERRLLPKKGTY